MKTQFIFVLIALFLVNFTIEAQENFEKVWIKTSKSSMGYEGSNAVISGDSITLMNANVHPGNISFHYKVVQKININKKSKKWLGGAVIGLFGGGIIGGGIGYAIGSSSCRGDTWEGLCVAGNTMLGGIIGGIIGSVSGGLMQFNKPKSKTYPINGQKVNFDKMKEVF